ncbi:solute carrier family 25 member 48 isoform X3 [Dromaius novaehollandiae]|uniref:Solute carrier family 25 member 48 n=1 Tax=Dromaius novaehollandiae TaxID=8790 RepID=A0A8C4JUY0_DRONO|nr:solute carrier family 25 member 48 isoform X1 [Dromaius novaehollandiae]XP_025974052.1 solute carrier family 25 member 48 isoform X1 [Dromaius novaehollandiae]
MAEAVDARKPGAHLSALRKTSVSPTPLLRLALGIAWEYQTRLQAGQGYGNTLNCVLTVYRNESVAGFFKGMAFPLASIAVYSSVVFGVFSNTQRLLSQLRYGDAARAPALPDMALASAVAGFVSVGIGTPVDLVKIRLQMQTQPSLQANVRLKPTVPGFPVYRGPIHCFRTVLQKEGIAGIYRGAGAMLLRDVPGYCLYFIPYAFFCGWITPDGCISPNPSSVWLAGGVAGAISWGTATPMDVVKSRLQADGVYVNKYKGILDCILQSYQSEGLKVFFRGITLNAVRGFPTSSAMFLGYELSLKAMKRDQTETNP